MHSLEWLDGFAEGLMSAKKFAEMAPDDKTAKGDIEGMLHAALLSAESVIERHPDNEETP